MGNFKFYLFGGGWGEGAKIESSPRQKYIGGVAEIEFALEVEPDEVVLPPLGHLDPRGSVCEGWHCRHGWSESSKMWRDLGV